MSLLTVERNSPSPQESDAEETLSSSSHEGFVAREHYVTSLPPRPWASLGRHGGEQLRIFTHLKKVIKLLRNSDTIKLAVELENSWPRKVTKHLVLVATNGYQDTEEAIVLGTEQEDSTVRVCLVLPIWRDTEIKLDGDGGFIVHSGDHQAVFKPSSVQSMWTTLQSLYQSTENARLNNYYVGGLSHTWMTYYLSQLTEDYLIRNEWNIMKDIESFRPDAHIYSTEFPSTKSDSRLEKQLVSKLRGIMLHEDLEEVTSRQLREKLEKEMNMGLTEYREFLDRNMLRILGQLEQPSKILDYLYLGSEWNASNLSELKELGIGYILNITREIDNFYPEVFKYLNIRLYDVPDSELIKHWEKTYRFIKEAKMRDTKVLVHCRMGISRSAATVIAYMMKEYQMPLVEAKKHVKGLRGCINPNEGFMGQLHSYEGILTARHNPLWGKHAPTRLYSKRSTSDPDIMQSLEKEELERQGQKQRNELTAKGGVGGDWGAEDSGEGFFRPIHNVASAYNIPNLYGQYGQVEEPELTFLAEEDRAGADGTTPHPNPGSGGNRAVRPTESLPAMVSLVHSTPVDKTRSLQHFLASLPIVVGSGTDDGLGDNIPTSNSGSAYSSPIYTPPDEESIHIHMAAQLRERDQTAESSPTTKEGSPMVSEALESSGEREKILLTEVAPLMPLRSHRPNSRSPVGSMKEALIEEDLAINGPVTQSHRSLSLPHALSGYAAVHAESSLSMVSSRKPATNSSSPTNSRLGHRVSSLLRQSPLSSAADDDRGGGGGEGGRRDWRQCSPSTGTPLQGECREEEEELQEVHERLHEDSVSTENMTPRTRERFMHHRRTKSDSDHNVSGPIKTAQISSVPERVKEIEEKGFQASTQSLNQIDLHPQPPSTAPPGSVSQSSSAECLAAATPEFSDSNPEKNKSSSPSATSSTKVVTESLTRRASLSPKPSSSAISPPHIPVSTSFSLPSSVSPSDLDIAASSNEEDILASSLHGVVKAKVQDFEGKKPPHPLPAAASSQQESRPTPSDSVVKRSLAATGPRPQSEIIFHTPYVGMVEVNDPQSADSSNNHARDSAECSSLTESLNHHHHHHRSSSSCGRNGDGGRPVMGRRKTSDDIFSSREDTSPDSRSIATNQIQTGAVFNAWIGMIPQKELQSNDLASVLERKQIFEGSKSKKDDLKRGGMIQQTSNLRRSRSLRDTRLTSPPVRLGGSGRWRKKYSSNASLEGFMDRHQRMCVSASPTASGSQQSLVCSGKSE